MSHTKTLRTIAEPFVVAPPGGARVRTRLRVDDHDAKVLVAVGSHLGSLASGDLAARCKEGAIDPKERTESRRVRKQALTKASSSRWAGAITRTTEDAYGLAMRNLKAERVSLSTRVKKLAGRTKAPAGVELGHYHGYSSPAERWEKQRRLQVLSARLKDVEAQLEAGTPSVCRGGKRLARLRHNLCAAGQSEAEWRSAWEASRWFITADGEKDKAWGNETIRWHPLEHWVELKLPAPLTHLANRPCGRYRLSCPVAFAHRGEEVAARATTGAVRYDISYDPKKGRWYIDASWKTGATPIATLDQLRRGPVVALDVNVGHLALCVLDCYGNPLGTPVTIPLVLDGLSATTRDARVREVISQVLALAGAHCAGAVVIENLDFKAQRTEGREHSGNRPSRGKRGKTFRRHISGLPTAKLRDRLTQMAYNQGVAVIAVDPAYTSSWGTQHWLAPLETRDPGASPSGHHAASVAVGRRGLGQRVRRRGTSARTSPADGERATASASEGWPIPTAGTADVLAERTTHREPLPRAGVRRPPKVCTRHTPNGGSKTTVPTGSEGDQVAQDRSAPPIGRDSVLLSV